MRDLIVLQEAVSWPPMILTPSGRIQQVIEDVALKYDVSCESILGEGRTQEVVEARQEVMWVLRARGLNYCAIGRRLNRDRTTVVHGIKAFEKRKTLRG